jgi:hypothetical protein
VQSALWALGETVRPENAVSTWTLAPPEVIEQLVVRGEEFDQKDSSMALAFCSAVRRRAAEGWSMSAIHRIACYARDAADPRPNVMPVRSSISGEEVTDNLEMSALNCVRGAAIYTLGALMTHSTSAIDVCLEALRFAANDPHPSVRIAVQAATRGLLKAEPGEALTIFLASCGHEDDRVLASSECRRFLHSSWRSHWSELAPLFERMIDSQVPAASQLGAEFATAAWFYDNNLEDLFLRCEMGTAPQRLGVARVAAAACSEDEAPKAKTFGVLLNSLRDMDATVGEAATEVFLNDDFLSRAFAPEVAAAYARSGAFTARPETLVRALARNLLQAERYLEAIGVMAVRFGELTGPKLPWSLDSELTTLILALYESTEAAKIREACLDAFDALLRVSSPRIQHYLENLGR